MTGRSNELMTERANGRRPRIALAAVIALACASVQPVAQASFPGGAGRIVVATGARDRGIVLLDSRGRHPSRLAKTGSEPRFSPDGDHIVYVRQSYGAKSRRTRGIFVLDLESGAKTRITSAADQVRFYDGSPQFVGPAGAQIVFASLESREGSKARNASIWSLNADGTDRRQLTQTSGGEHVYDSGPTSSPDGSLIAFARSYRRGKDRLSEILVMRPDGSHVRSLTREGKRPAGSPSFSPDGKRIVFESGGRLATVAVDGGPIRTLDVEVRAFYSPTYSPDGRRILVGDESESNEKLVSLDLDGRHPRVLTTGAGLLGGFDWGP